jgi:hypothetical protein
MAQRHCAPLFLLLAPCLKRLLNFDPALICIEVFPAVKPNADTKIARLFVAMLC